MNNDIAEMVSKCDICTTYRNKLPKQQLIHHEIPRTPWTKVGTDLFTLKRKEYMVVVDYTTKFVIVAQLERTDSACVIRKLKDMFSIHGIPKEVFSDGGPQFTSSQFNRFRQTWDFKHTRSSPHYPQSNGQVERTVQTVKRALRKALESGEDPYLALLTINTTPDASGSSPAEKLFGRNARSQIPSMRSHEVPREPSEAKFQPGTPVRIRYDTDKSWSRRGTIINKRAEPRSFDVLNERGNTIRVNERHIIRATGDDPSDTPIKIEDDFLDDLNNIDNNENTPSAVDHTTTPSTPTDTTTRRSMPTTTATPSVTTRSGRTIRRPTRYRQ